MNPPLKKPNRVSSASGANICQVKLFESEGCPSKGGLESQHHLQLKTSWESHSSSLDSDSCPDGYPNELKFTHYMNPLKEKLSHIPRIKWKCPPELVLNNEWLVAAGEESEEAEAQKLREMRVLEAGYPHLSAFQPSPSMSLDVEGCYHDDSHIPLVPITPIEEAAIANPPITAPLNTSTNFQQLDRTQDLSTSGNLNTLHCNPPVSLKSLADKKPALEKLPGSEGDITVAAAATALAAIMKSKEKGSLIDTDLLIEFLNNPEMIKKLSNDHGASTNTITGTLSGSKHVTPLVPLPSSKPDLVIKKSTIEHGEIPNSRPVTVTQSLPLLSSKAEVVTKKLTNEHGASAHMGTTRVPGSKPMTQSVPLTGMKPDMTLIKNLISEHRPPAREGTAHIAGIKPVAPLVPLPSAKPDVVMMKRLINEYGTPDTSRNKPLFGSKPPLVPLSTTKPDVSSRPIVHPIPHISHSSLHTSMKLLSQDKVLQSSLNMKSYSPDKVHTSPFSAMTAPPVKDIQYYKTLVRQHGEKQDTQDHILSQFGKPLQNLKPSESKPEHKNTCVYFNSSMGCRNGSKCPYQHDMSKQWRPGGMREAPGAKRMKPGGRLVEGHN